MEMENTMRSKDVTENTEAKTIEAMFREQSDAGQLPMEQSPAEQPSREQSGQQQSAGQYQEIEMVTLKFGKGCVNNEFTGKDGTDYKEIAIPNKDRSDKRPWRTFVVKANRVHENQFGKGLWCKLPANGSTTVKRSVFKGKDENGKSVWEDQKEKIPNRELKALVEFYKEQSRDNLQDKIAAKQEKIAQHAGEQTKQKSKALQETI